MQITRYTLVDDHGKEAAFFEQTYGELRTTQREAMIDILAGEAPSVYVPTETERIYAHGDLESPFLDRIVEEKTQLKWEGPEPLTTVELPDGVTHFQHYVRYTRPSGTGRQEDELAERREVIDGVMADVRGVVSDYLEEASSAPGEDGWQNEDEEATADAAPDRAAVEDYQTVYRMMDEMQEPVDALDDAQIAAEYEWLKESVQARIDSLHEEEEQTEQQEETQHEEVTAIPREFKPVDVATLFKIPSQGGTPESALSKEERSRAEKLSNTPLVDNYSLTYNPSASLTAFTRRMDDAYLDQILDIITESAIGDNLYL